MTVVNNPGSWSTIYAPLRHAEWHGCTPTDLVFPFFVFIMGTAIAFVMPTKTYDSSTFNKIFVRSLRMINLGLFFNFFGKIQFLDLEGIPLMIIRLLITAIVGYALMGNFNQKTKTYLAIGCFIVFMFLAYSGIPAYENVRLPGVLQRIGIIYFIASLLYLKTTPKIQLIVSSILLLGYWALMTLVPAPGFAVTNLEKGTNLATWVDQMMLSGHVWEATKTWDPEGILSTIPAIVTGLLGLQIGQLLNMNISKKSKAQKMLSIGALLLLLGWFWNFVFPINKALWTSSYVLYTAGLATLILTILYYCIDLLNFKKGITLFLVWGVNPMIVFFLSQIIPQALVMISVQNPKDKTPIYIWTYSYEFGVLPHFENPMNASLAFALLYVGFWSLILWYFYQKKQFFKV